MSSNEDQDAERRRNEMNMFSAFALGGLDGPAMNNDGNNGRSDHTTTSNNNFNAGSAAFDSGSLRIPAKAPANNNNNNQHKKKTTEEEERQHNDIAAFAALAGGDPSSLMLQPEPDVDTIHSRSSISQFSQAALAGGNDGISDSGTFAFSSNNSLPSSSAVESSLDKAAAALADTFGSTNNNNDDDMDGLNRKGFLAGLGSSIIPTRLMPPDSDEAGGAATAQPKMSPEYPMYTEEVRMPRPLFFGPIVPPRVLNEARLIVQAAFQQQGYDGIQIEAGEFVVESQNNNMPSSTTATRRGDMPPPPRLSSLPAEVQNLVGAIRSYGFGLSAFPFDEKSSKDEEAEVTKKFWKGTSYVSTFQPVFGDTARIYRQKHGVLLANGQEAPEEQQELEQHHHQQRQQQGSERPMMSNSVVGGSFDSPFAEVGRGSSSKASDQASSSGRKIIDDDQEKANAAFLANIAGESATNPQDNNNASNSLKKSISDFSMVKDDNNNDPSKNEINLFSMWARGEAAVDESDNNSQGNCSNDSFGSFTESNKGSRRRPKDNSGTLEITTKPPGDGLVEPQQEDVAPLPMSDQDLFSQWARGESPANNNNKGTFTSPKFQNSFVMKEKPSLRKAPPRYDFTSDAGGTFQRIPTTNLDDSDDDSIVGSEMKKKVGINEHLDKALASLVDDGLSTRDDGDETENSRNMLQVMRTTPGGRPLSNLELTNGCVPIFGVDDNPLPVEGDLGTHETKNDEQRTFEQNRSQEIIEKYAGPNIFGGIASPNPATGPDDNHSWNSRAAPSQRYPVGAGAGGAATTGNNHQDRVGVLPVPSDAHSPKPPAGPSRKTARNQSHSPKVGSRRHAHNHSSASSASSPVSRKTSKMANAPPSSGKRGGRINSRQRYGWWSIPEDFDSRKGGGGAVSSDHSVHSASEQSHGSQGTKGDLQDQGEDPLQIPPLYHPSQNLHVDTRLEPTPETLREENLPLSELHSATSIAHGLPYLSDRSPSYRYLQIDTQAVGFPPLKGDVEPLFCSLAIYNVETSSGPGSAAGHDAPMPDLERCGRITEVLNFDVVSDAQVEHSCIGSLWPFFASSTMTPPSSASASKSPATNASMSKNPSLQGTRCGVFPLPSNLNVANLYAVLIVQKVLSEDSDFEIYLKPSKSSRSSAGIDLNKYRSRAEKASNQHGSFLMPFAFGVAPLLQVFGAENPVVASSRAVQIPLFRFSAGKGERQIIDHIMVMLYPRADFRANGIGGPAAVTNGGTAMLVMRNFGYLGLHAVVHARSSLARDRLVDFTGELQIRRRNEKDPPSNNDTVIKKDDHTYVVPEWHPQFIAEPTVNGGRNSVDPFGGSAAENFDDNPSLSQLYAQELAPVPLSPVHRDLPRHSSGTTLSPRGARAALNRADIEPYPYASFCNELFCHPRLLNNCPKGNIVMKVELREMEWKHELNAFVAHLPQHGPSIHNSRRGPFLVQGTYTSCAVRSSDPHFLDEVKVKLPLELKSGRKGSSTRTLALFFSTYHVKFSSKKKWSKVLPLRTKRDSMVSGVGDVDDATGERTESSEDGDRSSKCKLLLLSCGFLPVTEQTSLIENGLHDVKMMYKARPPTTEMRSQGGVAPSSLIVTETSEASAHSLKDSQASSGMDPREDETTTGSSRTQSEAELAAIGGEESDGAMSDASGRLSDILNADNLLHSEGSHKSKLSHEHMTLQVRIVVHSSLHPQNTVLTDFLQQETDQPSAAVGADKEAMQILGLSRDEMVRQFEVGLLSSARLVMPEEGRMLNSIVSIAKPQFCSTSDISKHLFRVVSKMWKTLICGTGETDLSWANPASTMSLRVHTFGSLLQLLGSVALFMSKSGVTQVDGLLKFDITTLARVMSLLFDEESIFGNNVKEVLGHTDIFEKPPIKKKAPNKSPNDLSADNSTAAKGIDDKAPKRRRKKHQRNTFEFNTNRGGSIDMSDPTTNFGELVSGLSLPTSSGSIERSPPPSSTLVSSEEKARHPEKGIDGLDSLDDGKSAAADFDFSSLYPPTAVRENVKVDSMSDFKNNMMLGAMQEDDASSDILDRPLSASNYNSIMQKFGGLQGTGKGRYKTAPALATIREDEPDGAGVVSLSPPQPSPPREDDSLDSEIQLQAKSRTKQMRIPGTKKGKSPSSPKKNNPLLGLSLDDDPIMLPNPSIVPTDFGMPNDKHKYATMSAISSPLNSTDSLLLPNEKEIVDAGSLFLDSISQSFDVSQETKKDASGKGGRHRKTRSRCSIDWSLMGEEDYEIKTTPKDKPKSEPEEDSDDHDEEMTTLKLENSNCIRLPNYVDRLVALAETNDKNGRWFPFAYEVIIMMWSTFLQQQRDRSNAPSTNSSVQSSDPDAALGEAAASAKRATFACAPLLFEVIKQSLGYRVKVLRLSLKSKGKGEACQCPPLAVLDDALLARLENLISMITDACLSSRNFDSRDSRQMSIDVNDSIVRFLRDLFGFLKPESAHRLVLVYLSRFVTKEGKQGQDRDSSIGLRCSWEITKLRLNAMTALIRFPDFLRVCSPQMNSWSDSWSNRQGQASDIFFGNALDHYKRLQLSQFVSDVGFSASGANIPGMRPHWLAELVTEICLEDIWHAEQYIQQRAASLLHELFWASSQQSMGNGTAPIVGSMYVTFLEKVLNVSNGLSNYAPKSQLRKDILPCVLFVLQDAPSGLLRAQWRSFCARAQGKGSLDRYGGIVEGNRMFADGDIPTTTPDQSKTAVILKTEPDILDMFTLLNMALSTVEYEGCSVLLETDGGGGEGDEQIVVWQKEYLLTQGQENQQPFMSRRLGQPPPSGRLSGVGNFKNDKTSKSYFSSGSRKWQSHDSSIVIVNAAHQIVSEFSAMLQSSPEGQAHLNQARRSSMRAPPTVSSKSTVGGNRKEEFQFSRADTVIFVRAATSLYLHALSLRQSDLVLVRTFKVSVDLVKIFGIKMFLEAVGETLQHWMRVVTLHCGARRAKVRIEATDFLELILRCTWESFGSFFRIRIPLLAVQTEVMERIVTIAAARYYREERRKGTTLDNFSNASAEASLAPLWRTLDRLHHQQASKKPAYKGALIRLAVKLKKLYKAYIAARALSYLSGVRSPKHSNGANAKPPPSDSEALVRAYRITVLRVLNLSAGYSKQFLGFHGLSSLSNSSVAHYEAVEDAFLDAADVFSPTELPEHRVAWLQMLADFHASRTKPGEEATCHFQIHATLKQASSLHGSLWSNTPFLPWTNSPPDPVHIDGEGQSGNPLDTDLDLDDIGGPHGRQMDDANSSRRIFYRVANSVRANTEEWETGLTKTLFCGVTFPAEYCSVSSWITLREMEEKMVEEAECAGDLFLRAGIIESCRFVWNLAAQYYSEKFSYGKLANVYGCLARAFVSRVPPIDATQQQEVSISMGRFYRVYFHGGAPDELMGAEFVYRTASWVRLEQFGNQLREVIKCIVPDRTPIHLALDGRTDEGGQRNYGGFSRLQPIPLEPVKIKVTPLRPHFAKGSKIRGLPEWFDRYVDEVSTRAPTRLSNRRRGNGSRTGNYSEEVGRIASPGHRGNNVSFGSSASMFASGGSSASGSMFARRSSLSKVADGGRRGSNSSPGTGFSETELVGVDKFGFLQPKDRLRGNKDWWKPASGDFAQKSLRKTVLQVGQAFPACVTRQGVVDRVVFTLSPLEAGVDGVCQWCSVLFRTAVATHGMAVLGTNTEPGIGTDAAKVVTDCIHSSRVKEMGVSLLKKSTNATEEEVTSELFQSPDRLGDDEVKKFQNKLARAIIVFLELLHLLIARNRDLLLSVIQERKKELPNSVPPAGPSGVGRSQSAAISSKSFSTNPRTLLRHGSHEGPEGSKGPPTRAVSEDPSRIRPHHERHRPPIDDHSGNYGVGSASYGGGPSLPGTAGNGRNDAATAVAVQSELQRSFITLTKTLYPGISGIMQTETPRWLKQCTQENYFSLGNYRQTRLRISEELSFSSGGDNFHPGRGPYAGEKPNSHPPMGEYMNDRMQTESPSASVASSSVFSRTSKHVDM